MDFINTDYAKLKFYTSERNEFSRGPRGYRYTPRAVLRPMKRQYSRDECRRLVYAMNQALRIAISNLDERIELEEEWREQCGYKPRRRKKR